jgi:periplasmic divalent cation tolerance protein
MGTILVISNLPDLPSAERLANRLVAERAAACVNILSACRSVYQWQGKLESATEVPVLIKTSESGYNKVEEIIRSEHPYELPEIIAVPITAGLPEYLAWIRAETKSN